MARHSRRLIEGRLRLELRAADGRVLTARRARNTVLRSGAELIAALFDGSIATPINGMAVGLDPTPSEPPYETAALTTTAADGTVLIDRAAAPVPPDALVATVDADAFRVRVAINATLPADRAVSPDADIDEVAVAEAALGILAADGNSLSRIYNRVTFDPIPKRRSQELAFFWEVDFPYGT